MTISNEFLTVSNFSLAIEGMESLAISVSKFNHPGVQNPEVKASSRRLNSSHTGTKLDINNLSVTIHLEETMKSYDEILEWMRNCVSEPLEKDITLTIYSVTGKALRKVTYFDAFPVKLGGIEFNSTDQNDTLITLDIDFAFTDFTTQSI